MILLLACFDAAGAMDGSDLIAAVKRGDRIVVEQLLDSGVAPDYADQHNNTALIFAARDGFTDIAELLVERGATVDWIDGEGVTPLILAAFKGHEAIAAMLLQRGADSRIRDQWGRDALDYALRRGLDDPIAIRIRRRR